MKIFSLLAAAACITALSVPASARAEEESGGAWSIDGTVTLASDYRFRGYSLTDKKPAVQPELWVRHDSGLYAGFWGSNVSGLGGDDIEFDPAVGYSGSLGPVDVDLWAIREIVIAHRGTITACNNPGGGASLIVTLPQESGNNQ